MKFANILVVIILLCMSSLTFAANRVSIQMVRTGDAAIVDTAYLGYAHQLWILIENDFLVGGMSLGFKIYSNQGLTWSWDPQPNGLPESGMRAVTIIPGCRIDPPSEVLDLTGLIVTEINVDGASADSIMPGGIAMLHGLQIGPLEPMLAFHFTPQDIPDGSADMICIDSAFIPPSGEFILYNPACPVITPEFDGPFCWSVREFSPTLGDFDLDLEITVGDPVEMIKYIFKDKPHFAPVETGDVNCDGELNVGDVLYMINYIFRFGPAPGCP